MEKVCILPSAASRDEVLTSAVPFLYGGNVVKAHVGRWSEDCPEHSGVVVYSMVRFIWILEESLANFDGQDDTPLVRFPADHISRLLILMLNDVGLWSDCAVDRRGSQIGKPAALGLMGSRHTNTSRIRLE